jgi:hypothetical protein
MSETSSAQLNSFEVLNKLSDNEIADILSKRGVKDVLQITKNDFYRLRKGRQANTLFDVRPSNFNVSNSDLFDVTKGKVQLVVIPDGRVAANIDNKRLELQIPTHWGDYEFSKKELDELTNNGYIKERIKLKNDFEVFIGVDKELNCVVSMPIKMLLIPSNVLGVNNPLTDDQLKSLRNGYGINYIGYKDKDGNVSNKEVFIDRIRGGVGVKPMKSGLETAQKADQVKDLQVENSQSESESKDESKKKSKAKGV